MTWTKKHDEFALACQLRPSTKLLLRWLLRRANPNVTSELEIDLKKFNRWVGKTRGKEFDRKTIREAIAQLEELTFGLVVIHREYTAWVKKLVVRPLTLVLREKSQNGENSPNVPTSKPMFDSAAKQRAREQQQQDIFKLDSLLSNLGLRYTKDRIVSLWRMAGKSVTDVQRAVELMLYQNSTQEEEIRNPHGWLYDCVRYGWQENFDCYYQVKLPYFQSGEEIEDFVRGMLPQSITETPPLPT